MDHIDGLAESQQTADESVRKHFLTRLIKMSQNAVFDGWDDYPVTLLRICTVFADEKKLREQLLEEYWNVCAMLKRYGKLAGKSSQNAIIQELHEKYYNRPALLDELSKL